MVERPACPVLSPGQQNALSRLRFALEEPAGFVILCGPAGAGTSVVLAALASELGPRHQEAMPIRTVASLVAAIGRGEPIGETILVDDVHLAASDDLAAIAAAAPPQGAGARCVVLAGRGRLLTLVGRDSRIAPRVRLRAIVPPLAPADTARIVESRLGRSTPELVRTIHEITAGIPAALNRLLDLATLIEGRTPTPADIETIHRRLELQGA